MVEHQLGEARASIGRSHPHSLDLAVLRAEQLDTSTANRGATVSDDEERNGVGNQFRHAETVTTLAWIERLEVGVELRDQRCRIGARRMLRRYDDCHLPYLPTVEGAARLRLMTDAAAEPPPRRQSPSDRPRDRPGEAT